MLPKSIQKTIDEFSRLPGIGPKTASRLVFYLIKQPDHASKRLGLSLSALHDGILFCKVCFNVTDQDPCAICEDERREASVICVVEQPLDTVAIEKTDFSGKYHVLGGVISPIDGVNPDNLRIRELVLRVQENAEIKELIIATNPSIEGEATALYITKAINEGLPERNIKITRIAHGLPMGGDLEYADAITLSRALEGRQAMQK